VLKRPTVSDLFRTGFECERFDPATNLNNYLQITNNPGISEIFCETVALTGKGTSWVKTWQTLLPKTHTV
jgi:hypothetical protein